MNKQVVFALVLIALSVLVMIFTRGSVSLNLLFGTVKLATSVALLCFTAVGVAIGLLLK